MTDLGIQDSLVSEIHCVLNLVFIRAGNTHEIESVTTGRKNK